MSVVHEEEESRLLHLLRLPHVEELFGPLAPPVISSLEPFLTSASALSDNTVSTVVAMIVASKNEEEKDDISFSSSSLPERLPGYADCLCRRLHTPSRVNSCIPICRQPFLLQHLPSSPSFLLPWLHHRKMKRRRLSSPSPSPFASHASTPGLLWRARLARTLIRGNVHRHSISPEIAVSTFLPAAMVAASKHEEKKAKANFSFSSSFSPKRVDGVFVAAPPRVDCCIASK